jgi:hypothetical protein
MSFRSPEEVAAMERSLRNSYTEEEVGNLYGLLLEGSHHLDKAITVFKQLENGTEVDDLESFYAESREVLTHLKRVLENWDIDG